MKHRLAALLLALMTAYLSISFAETTPADSPGSLREADSAEEVASFLIYPPEATSPSMATAMYSARPTGWAAKRAASWI